MWLHKKVSDFLKAVGQANSKLVIGVSGGPDSLALLHILWKQMGADRLVAAYLNHGWRDSAVSESEQVRQTAVAWGIPFQIAEQNVPELARKNNWSLEEAGRNARYLFFAEVAREVGATVIAVGHNADDQAETILMHLLRGSGLRGLAGMPAVSPLPGAPDLQLIRPFLTTSRAEIESYCRENELKPVYDPTNQDTAFFRNRVRHKLLPLLTEYNPQIRQRLRQMAASMAADEAFLQEQTAVAWGKLIVDQGPDWLSLNRNEWQTLPASLKLRLLRQSVATLRPSAEIPYMPIQKAYEMIERPQSGQTADLPGGVTLLIESDALHFRLQESALPAKQPQLINNSPLPLLVPGRVDLAAGWQIIAELVDAPNLTEIRQNQDPWLAYLAMPDLSALQIRPRQAGERIQPLGMDGRSTKLKEVMIDRKIPARLRSLWPLVVGEGRPLWMVGHILDERARVTETSEIVLKIHCFQE